MQVVFVHRHVPSNRSCRGRPGPVCLLAWAGPLPGAGVLPVLLVPTHLTYWASITSSMHLFLAVRAPPWYPVPHSSMWLLSRLVALLGCLAVRQGWALSCAGVDCGHLLGQAPKAAHTFRQVASRSRVREAACSCQLVYIWLHCLCLASDVCPGTRWSEGACRLADGRYRMYSGDTANRVCWTGAACSGCCT